MSILNPQSTTCGDLLRQGLKEAGVLGIGQMPVQEELIDAQFLMQGLLQEWQRKRWMVYHLVTRTVVSTGARAYTIGPQPTAVGGLVPDIPTSGDYGPEFNSDFSHPPQVQGGGIQRPSRLETAFLRQLVDSQPNEIDYPLFQLPSMEDYARIALKGLISFPGVFFYDPALPLGYIYPWPVPQANIYALGVVIREALPTYFPTQATQVVLPYEYYNALTTNLGMALRGRYGLGAYPGDTLPKRAAEAKATIAGTNTAIARLVIDPALTRPEIYNIFSDQSY